MTEQNKLLLKDLCGRLTYGVKAEVMGWDEEKEKEVFVPVTVCSVNTDGYVYFADNDYDITYCSIDACRLYLRPMSSMTEEEEKIFNDFLDFQAEYVSDADLGNKTDMYDWLLEHHFDFRGLIEKGLALEALPGMYKTE